MLRPILMLLIVTLPAMPVTLPEQIPVSRHLTERLTIHPTEQRTKRGHL